MCSRASDFEGVVDEGVGEGVGGIDFATIAAHESEIFDVGRDAATDAIEDVGGDVAADVNADFVDVAYDVVEDVEGDVATDVDSVDVADSVGLVSRHEMIDRESSNVVGLVGVVLTHEMMKKESFEAGVDDKAVGALATAVIEKKNNDFNAFWGVVSDCFSGFLTWCFCTCWCSLILLANLAEQRLHACFFVFMSSSWFFFSHAQSNDSRRCVSYGSSLLF